jgi:tol-pal system protein YbgF
MAFARKLILPVLAAALFAAPAHAQFWQRNEQPPQPPSNMQGDPGELSVRIERLESQLRQLTGVIEQLQHQNQQLQQQLRAQGDNQPPQQRPLTQQQRPQYVPPSAQQNVVPPPQQQAVVPPLPPIQNQQQQQPYPPQNPKGRGDAFDPDANPNAPGTPRNLGAIRQQQNNGPMDLSPNNNPSYQNLPPPDQNQPGPQQQAVLPPSSNPKDSYDLAYGYILRRDYGLAEQSFRSFIDQYPQDRNIPTATYWLGESLYYQRKHNDAAEVFLEVYNKHPNSQRAPDSLLRLGQSLAALGKKEAACASLGAVLSKYPKASPTVKKNAEDEQKRLSC